MTLLKAKFDVRRGNFLPLVFGSTCSASIGYWTGYKLAIPRCKCPNLRRIIATKFRRRLINGERTPFVRHSLGLKVNARVGSRVIYPYRRSQQPNAAKAQLQHY